MTFQQKYQNLADDWNAGATLEELVEKYGTSVPAMKKQLRKHVGTWDRSAPPKVTKCEVDGCGYEDPRGLTEWKGKLVCSDCLMGWESWEEREYLKARMVNDVMRESSLA